MKVLVVGDKRRFNELTLKLPEHAAISHLLSWQSAGAKKVDFIFDLNFDDSPGNIKYFAHLKIPVFCCAVKKQLAEAVFEYSTEIKCQLIGMNLFPEFINKEVSELSVFNVNHDKIAQIMQQLKWKFRIVEDRTGMITSRIIFMIINEACFTLQEGTATIHDIDLAMKLGTNYPFGPFEWADRIGIRDIYESLDAIYRDTHDERYKICPLLKTKYLKKESFY